jgi:serine/threonine protein kinase
MGLGLGLGLGLGSRATPVHVPPKRPIAENWKKLSDTPLGEGGQGRAFLVVKASGGPDEKFVFKELKNQKSDKARRRICREVATLAGLQHSGLPKLVESNASHDMAATDIPLWVVIEFIAGNTLAKQVSTSIADFECAKRLLLALLDVLQYCHGQNARHRDLKPENMVLRESDWGKPVVVDFGLTFNKDSEAEDLTQTQETFGNSFLQLPEYQNTADDKTSPVSDVTSALALFLYSLTGIRPKSLQDSSGLKPHMRKEVREILIRSVPSDVLPRLDTVFDRAFRMEIKKRFETARMMRQAFIAAVDGAPPEPEEDGLRQTLEHLQVIRMRGDRWKGVSAEIERVCGDVIAGYNPRLEDFFQADHSRFENPDAPAVIFYCRFRPKSPGIPTISCEIITQLKGSSVDVSLSSVGDATSAVELLSFDIGDHLDKDALTRTLRVEFEKFCNRVVPRTKS